MFSQLISLYQLWLYSEFDPHWNSRRSSLYHIYAALRKLPYFFDFHVWKSLKTHIFNRKNPLFPFSFQLTLHHVELYWGGLVFFSRLISTPSFYLCASVLRNRKCHFLGQLLKRNKSITMNLFPFSPKTELKAIVWCYSYFRVTYWRAEQNLKQQRISIVNVYNGLSKLWVEMSYKFGWLIFREDKDFVLDLCGFCLSHIYIKEHRSSSRSIFIHQEEKITERNYALILTRKHSWYSFLLHLGFSSKFLILA